MLNPQTNPGDAVIDTLATYLHTQIPTLTVLRQWPNANQVLSYPSVTLTLGKITVMNRPPEVIAKTAPDVNNKIIATEVIGEVDFPIQADLWCANKPQRSEFLGSIINAVNAQAQDPSGNNNPAGISLELTNYYNDFARIDLNGWQHVEDEAGSQRQERRSKLDLRVNCRIIVQRTYYAMKTIQTSVGVGPSIPMTSDTSNTETTTL